MKRLLLGLALTFAGSAANAAGLYLSAGYGKSNPEFSISELSADSGDCWDSYNNTWNPNCAYGPEYQYIAGFPTGKVLANYDPGSGIGLQADDFPAGLPSNYDFEIKEGNTKAFAVGWDLSQNPFRFEFEYQKTKFKSPGYTLVIDTGPIPVFHGMYQDPEAAGYPAGTPAAMDNNPADGGNYADDGNNCANGICINKNEWGTNPSTPATLYDYLDFEASFYKDMDASVDSYMGNVYFEIPGFGSIDPYIGYGFGFSRLNYDLYIPDYDTSGNISEIKKYTATSAYENATQLIAGVEYRFDETPVIFGVEYRQFKTKFKDEEGSTDDFKHKYVMFKLRYDFISDEF